MLKKWFYLTVTVFVLGFFQFSASCASYDYDAYMGIEEIPYGGTSTGYGYGSFTMYDEAGAEQADVPAGYTGYVLKVVDSGAQQLGFSVDLSDYLVSDVKAIKFRIYCEGTSSTSVRLSGDNCASFALNSPPSALNEWIEVSYEAIASLADSNGHIKNFHFGLRKGTVLYVDSITVTESEKISENLATGKNVTLTGYNYDGNANRNSIKTSTISTATDCSIDNYIAISGVFHLDAEIDLGSVQYISGAKLYRRMTYLAGGANSNARMRVEVSADGEEWTSLGIMEKEGDNANEVNTKTYQVLTISITATPARYIRFIGMDIHNGTLSAVSEIAVFPGEQEETDPQVSENLATGKNVTLTGYNYDGNAYRTKITSITNETLTDGDTGTYTAISGVFHLDAEIDLGSVQYISGAKLYRRMTYLAGGANSNARMRVEVSADGEEWTSLGIMEKEGDNANVENTKTYQVLKICFTLAEARFVRFIGMDIHNGTQSAISEIEIVEGVQKETEPPVINLTNGEYYVPAGTKIRFDDIATDNSGAVDFKLEWSKGAIDRSGKLLEGVHTLTITATDKYLNHSRKTVVFNVSNYDVTLTKNSVLIKNAISECQLFVTCYDEHNALLDVVCIKDIVNNNRYDITEIPSETRVMKAFVWESDMRPITIAQKVNID